jgi:ParB-like chromosome segregation protein Spo0J
MVAGMARQNKDRNLPSLRYEEVAIADLVMDPANVRKHPDRNLQALKASLARFGQQLPILVSEDNVVLAGNGRLQAAKDLGWTTIRIARTSLQGTEATAYAIADNRTAELAGWDLDGLDLLLRDLATNGVDLEAVGFTTGDLAQLLGPAEFARDETAAPEREVQYSEKIIIKVTDMPSRSKIKAAVEALLEREGWTSVASIP